VGKKGLQNCFFREITKKLNDFFKKFIFPLAVLFQLFYNNNTTMWGEMGQSVEEC